MLAVFSLLAKLIGAMYRIPLTNIIGAEGIGLYQMVFPLYTVLLTVSSGGLPTAISKVISGLHAKKDEKGARRALKIALVSLLIAGLAAAIFMIVFRGIIAQLQGNPKAALAYAGIAPSLVFTAVISCFRGFYQGGHNMFPSALSQIIEQSFKLFAGLALARTFLSRGVEYAVFGAVLGVSLAEGMAMLVLLIQFYFTDRDYKRRNVMKFERLRLAMEAGEHIAIPKGRAEASTRVVLKNIYQIAIPVTLGSLVLPLTQVVDSILVINMLISAGVERTAATGLFGIINGPISSIINMPAVITLAIAVALLPSVSAAVASKQSDIPSMAGAGLKYGMLIGLPCAVVFAFFAPEILSVLYKRALSPEQIETAAMLLRIESISVVYIALLQVATSVLQGIGRAHLPALNLLAGAVVKILLTIFFLPRIGVAGAVIGTVACYGITCILDIYCMKKYTDTDLSFGKFFVAPVLSCTVMAGVSYLFHRVFVAFLPLPSIVSFAAALSLGGIAYVFMAFITRAVTKSEVLSFVKK